MLKIQYISDVHGQFNLVKQDPTADIMIIAGDLCDGLPDLSIFMAWSIPIIYVLGNHETYGNDSEGIIHKLKHITKGTNIRVLERDVWIYRGVRFIGCTGWTDMFNSDPWIIKQAAAAMSDYKYTKANSWFLNQSNNSLFQEGISKLPPHDFKENFLHPLIVCSKHQQAKNFIEQSLSIPFDGPTFVITHHPPSSRALRHSGRWLPEPSHDNDFETLFEHFPKAGWHRLGTYSSRLDDLIIKHQPTAWIHGHIHKKMEYFVGNTIVLMNAIGHRVGGKISSSVFSSEFGNDFILLKKRETLLNLTRQHAHWIQNWVLPIFDRDIDVYSWTPSAYNLHIDAIKESISLGSNALIPISLSFESKQFWNEALLSLQSKMVST